MSGRRGITAALVGLDTMAREELGIDPRDLGGSRWTAAGASFLLLAVGAVIPVIPFMFPGGMHAVWISLGFASGACSWSALGLP